LAAARPPRAPRGQHGVSSMQSRVTNAIRTILIWPYARVFRTGSRKSTGGSSQANAHHDLPGGPARQQRNTLSTTATRAMLARVSTVPATAVGTSDNGDSKTAATGG
jgi:hypothetical protein